MWNALVVIYSHSGFYMENDNLMLSPQSTGMKSKNKDNNKKMINTGYAVTQQASFALLTD